LNSRFPWKAKRVKQTPKEHFNKNRLSLSNNYHKPFSRINNFEHHQMKSKRTSVALLVFPLFVAALAPHQTMAQAYVDQARSAPKGGAYVPQASPELRRPVKKTVTQVGRTTVGQQNGARNKPAPQDVQFPTVGAGSSAIVKMDADESAWPTVGDGLRK
jgi:hypothetical protein